MFTTCINELPPLSRTSLKACTIYTLKKKTTGIAQIFFKTFILLVWWGGGVVGGVGGAGGRWGGGVVFVFCSFLFWVVFVFVSFLFSVVLVCSFCFDV